ncbi:MAG: hypothetical protein AAFP77_11420 [Bacteroidota bacterium]
MLRSLLLLLALAGTCTLSAQLTLDGLWEGTITTGGIESNKGYPVQLYLKRTGKKVTGRSYVYISETNVVEMSLEGRLYDDLSIYIDEVEFVNHQEGEPLPDFLRKYQLIWNRGINGSSINGYWQEIRQEIFDYQRQRGRIFLKQVINNKA